MSLQLNPDTLNAVADIETFRRFTQGTAFQQSMNMLAMIDQYLAADQQAMLQGLNLSPQQHQQAALQLDVARKSFLKLNPPPDIDPEALRLYCD
jgi:hypothetical protein